MENELEKKEKCKCGNSPQELHTCPYAEDVQGDSITLCNCCSDCENQCIADI
jgi:hypothetical protein